jgi:hypothetical protein
MCSWRPTHAQYAHQRVVATFSDLITYYNERGLTHIFRTRSCSAIIEGVEYEVRRYIATGALPYEEWSEERPWTDEEEWYTLILTG